MSSDRDQAKYIMRNWIDLVEGVRDDIGKFATDFNNPKINTSIHQQAANKNPAWKKLLVKLMGKYGFSLIGAGTNGAVFENPALPYVLKVYRADPMYEEWLYFCRKYPNNVYVPKIKGHSYRLNDVFTAIRLEKLVSCDINKANDLIAEIDDILMLTWKDQEKIDTIEDRDLVEISKFMREWEQVNDLTHHNIMARPNGQMVIVDPIYQREGHTLDW